MSSNNGDRPYAHWLVRLALCTLFILTAIQSVLLNRLASYTAANTCLVKVVIATEYGNRPESVRDSLLECLEDFE